MKFKNYDGFFMVIDCGGNSRINLKQARETFKKDGHSPKECYLVEKNGNVEGDFLELFFKNIIIDDDKNMKIEKMSPEEIREKVQKIYSEVEKDGIELEIKY